MFTYMNIHSYFNDAFIDLSDAVLRHLWDSKRVNSDLTSADWYRPIKIEV